MVSLAHQIHEDVEFFFSIIEDIVTVLSRVIADEASDGVIQVGGAHLDELFFGENGIEEVDICLIGVSVDTRLVDLVFDHMHGRFSSIVIDA